MNQPDGGANPHRPQIIDWLAAVAKLGVKDDAQVTSREH